MTTAATMAHTPRSPASRGGVVIREATRADNAALVTLAAECPMRGDVALCVERAPDFFALTRLEGDRWRVGVAEEASGHVVGCVAVAARVVYLRGRPSRVMYACDLKVHPLWRGGPAADALIRYAQTVCGEEAGADAPLVFTVLAGNRAMERRAGGVRGGPVMRRFATVRAHTVTFLWPRRVPHNGLHVARASWRDVEEMTELWRRVAPTRQLAAVYEAESLAAWVRAAPGLDIGDYWLARGPRGRLAGFFGLWDQASFKQLRVTGYSPRLAAFRLAFNAVAPLWGAAKLPAAGEPLRSLTAVHLCVPRGEPRVLRALIVHAYNALRGRGYSFFTVGLDVRDPLRAALAGLLAQPTDIHAYVTTAAGRYDGPALDERPLHWEVALT